MLKESVETALEEIRPALRADGGDVELVEVTDDGIVTVKLTGACHGCPMGMQTLELGIEAHLRKMVPQVRKVLGV
jgi:Fe-S cluster biogenesis protein NfuA